MPSVPPIRDSGMGIEIDADKGKWPFIKAIWAEHETTGKIRLVLIIDSNEGGSVINEGQGIAMLALSKKKVKAFRDFLDRSLDEISG